MTIISFMATKGGSGKSLLTKLMATELALSGNVGIDLICADHPQHSTHKWYELAKDKPGFPEQLTVYKADSTEQIADLLNELTEKAPVAIRMIDVGGHEGSHVRFAMLASDIILVPTRVNPAEMVEAVGICLNLREQVPEAEKTLCILRNDVGSLAGKLQTYQEAMSLLQGSKIPFLETQVMHRDPFVRFSYDQPSLEAMQESQKKSSDSIAKARQNIRDLLVEIVSLIQGRNTK